VFQAKPTWASILPTTDQYGFTFQATLWSLDACTQWYKALCARFEEKYPAATTDPADRRKAAVLTNFAENPDGQRFFWKFFEDRGQIHLGWIRAGGWSNAVYLSPWPYRPTAIVQGRLETWAEELGRREGLPFLPLSKDT
jgi:hypothetical protein